MPEFVLNRNLALRTLHGHIINFVKGEPTYVPPIAVKDAVGVGAVCVAGDGDIMEPEEAVAPPMSPAERADHIVEAFKALEERAERTDFTAAGAPTENALSKEVGFVVAKPEFDPLWTAYIAEKGVTE